MKQLWRTFEKILWKQRQIEEKNHIKNCAKKGTVCVCKTIQEEFHQWEDYAIANFKDATMAAMSY